MQLTYSLLVKYNPEGNLSQLLITELANFDILPIVKIKMRISDAGNDTVFYGREEEQPLLKKEVVETNWRTHISAVFKEHIENLLSQDSSFNLLEKTAPPKDRKNLGRYDHFETVTAEIDVKAGFFERNFGMIGISINFLAALANMGVQILAIEMLAADGQSSGRKYAVPMSCIAFMMAILTYNYSDAPTVLSNCGKKIDKLSVVGRLAASLPFKQIGSCVACVGGCWGSVKTHFFSKSTTESSDANGSCAYSATCHIFARLVPPAVIVAMQAIWTIVASIEAFQTSYATAMASKKIESFMTDDIAYGLSFTLAVSSGIAMGSFYVPFIANCVAEWLKKVDRYYQSHVLDLSHVRPNTEASTDDDSTQASRRSKRSEEENLDLESQYIENSAQSRRFTY